MLDEKRLELIRGITVGSPVSRGKKNGQARDGSETQAPADTGTGSQDMRHHLLLSVHHCHQLCGVRLSERGNLYAVLQVNGNKLHRLIDQGR